MYVKVMAHPNYVRGAYEVLFSSNGRDFITVDGMKEKDLIGFTASRCKNYSEDSPVPYRIFGKSLAEKIMFLKLHVKYKQERAYLNLFYNLARRLVDLQCRTDEDFQIPEIVQGLANLPESMFIVK